MLFAPAFLLPQKKKKITRLQGKKGNIIERKEKQQNQE